MQSVVIVIYIRKFFIVVASLWKAVEARKGLRVEISKSFGGGGWREGN